MARKDIELKIGVFVTIGVVLLVAMIVVFGEFRFFHQTYKITCFFKQSIGGITPGVDVSMLGKRIGKATAFDITKDQQVKAVLQIDKEYSIPAGSQVKKVQRSFLGDYYLAITPPPPGDDIEGSVPKDGKAVLDGVVDASISELAPKVSRILTDYEPKLAELIKNLNSTVASLNKIVSDPDTQKHLKDTLRDTSLTMAKGPGIAEDISTVVKSAAVLVDSLNKTTQNFNARMEALGNDYQTVAKDINSVTKKLNEILSSMQKISDKATSESTVGKLVSDKELYGKMVEALDEARSTLAQIKRTMKYFEEHPSDIVWGGRNKPKKPETPAWWQRIFTKEDKKKTEGELPEEQEETFEPEPQ